MAQDAWRRRVNGARELLLRVLLAFLAGDGLDVREAAELAVDACDAFHLALGREALVEALVAEGA